MMLRPTANELRRSIRHLGSRSPERVDSARARLCLLGGRAVDALIEALEGGSNRLRARVMPLLALIQDPRGCEPLVAMLLDRSPRLREVAARSLGRFPRPDSVAALTRLLERERAGSVREAAVQALVEQHRAGREEALGPVLGVLAAGGRGSRARRAAVAVVPLLPVAQRRTIAARLEADRDPAVRRRLGELSSRGASGQEARRVEIDRCLHELASSDYACWNGAVHRLAARGAAAVAPLIDAMRRRDRNPEYCARAAAALKGMGPRQLRALGPALETVTEPLPLQSLVEVAGTAGEKSLVYRLVELIDRLQRRRGPGAGSGTGAAGAGDTDAVAGEEDPFRRVRARAHLELARVGSRVAIADLREALADERSRAHLELLSAVELIGKRDELPVLLSAWRAEGDTFARGRIADAVRTIMRRERIRRSARLFRSLGDDHARALVAILPRKRARPSPRRAARARRERV